MNSLILRFVRSFEINLYKNACNHIFYVYSALTTYLPIAQSANNICNEFKNYTGVNMQSFYKEYYESLPKSII